MKNGFKVMDSDMHIIEPPDLWLCYIKPEFKDQVPWGTTNSVADFNMIGPDGKMWGRSQKNVANWELNRSYFKKSQERFRLYAEMGWNGDAQLKAMDVEGIDVAAIYPSRGLYALAVPNLDPKLAASMAQAYNNWLYDFCAHDRRRLIGVGMISPFNIDDAVSESKRCVEELGFRGVFLRPNIVNGRNWHDFYYEPLWAALEMLDVPIGFHEGVSSALPYVGEQFGENIMLGHTFSHPIEQMLAAASFCGAGILARHPRLKVAFLEGNCSWLPFFLWRLDEHWERLGDVYAPDLVMPPSEYWKRQCFTSVEADEDPMKYTVDYLGSGGLVFSTDFPHADSKFPKSVDRFLQINICEEDKRKILWDNCVDFYGLD